MYKITSKFEIETESLIRRSELQEDFVPDERTCRYPDMHDILTNHINYHHAIHSPEKETCEDSD